MRGSRSLAVVAATLGLTVVLAPGEAWGPVPPKNCGMLDARGKTFNIKADQIRCRTARKYAKAYLVSSRRPSGFTCRNFGRDTKIKFRCWKGNRVLFAIRR